MFTNDLLAKVVSLSLADLDYHEIANRTGLRSGQVYGILHRRGIRPKGLQRARFNERYFEDIRSQYQAYWLGFMFADGCIIRRKYDYSSNIVALRVGLSIQDRQLLDAFLIDIQSSPRIAICNNGKEARVSLNSVRMVNDLESLGCVERKSLKLTGIPDIPAGLVRHFVRGYFDGDGSVSVQNKTLRINMLGTFEFLSDIRKTLLMNGVSFTEPKVQGKTNCFVLAGNGNKKAQLFYNYIYTGAERFLLRKKETFDAVL